MTLPDATVAEALAALRADQAESARAGLARFETATLTWLAALPEWSVELATRLGFPAGDHPGVPALVAALETAGIAQSRPALEPDGRIGLAFWLPASRRGEVGAYLRGTGFGTTLDDLRAALHRPDPLPPAVGALREMLDLPYLDPTGGPLLDAVDGLLDGDRAVDATRLVAAAECLGEVVGDPLAASARRAQWRLGRAYRQAADAAALRHYQPRTDPEQALADLIAGAGHWALHIRGDGGVGKTMLLRHLASAGFAERHGLPPTVFARVDFDHLDPRYPFTRPADLLLALADDLTGYTGTRGERRRRRHFDDAAFALHELTQGSLDDPALGAALERTLTAFAVYLADLGQCVVLVLDTCEELVKAHAPGAMAPAVARTVDMLTFLHEWFPGLRVVLAGRRWLGPPGHERVPPAFGDGLRPVELGGFSRAEAAEFLIRRDPGGRIATDVRAAILERCADPDGTWNPFQLSAYAQWAVDDPALTAGRLRASAGDPYVEQRILGRVGEPAVVEALPAALALGRFDLGMIEPALRRRRLDPQRTFADLAAHEWVHTRRFDEAGRARVVEVDPNLAPRLRAALPRLPETELYRLGRDAADRCFAGDLDEAPAEAVEAALRLLPVGDAAAFWDRVDETLLAEHAWGWAAQVMPRAAAAELERPAGPTILAAVRATQAATTLRVAGPAAARELWHDVWRLADRHPAVPDRARLRARAVCGEIVADPHRSLPALPDLDRARSNGMVFQAAPVGSLIAAAEALLLAGADAEPFAAELHVRERAARGGLRAAIALTRAAIAMRHERFAVARDELTTALAASAGNTPVVDLDWPGIANPLYRARLARLRLAVATAEPPADVPDEVRLAGVPDVADLDAERLAAAQLDYELDWTLPERPDREVRFPPERVAGLRPTSVWHAQTPPYFVAHVRLLLVTGRWTLATELVQRWREEAIARGQEPDTVQACDVTLAAVCRLARTTRPSTSLHRLAKDPDPQVRAAAWPALFLATGERPRDPAEAGTAHVHWQLGGRLTGLPASRSQDGPAHDAAQFADRAMPVDDESTAPEVDGPLPAWIDALRRGEIPAVLTADRTGTALLAVVRVELVRPRIFPADALAALPPRWYAQALLAEGELLALRDADLGAELLRRAETRYRAAGDRLGADRARLLRELAEIRAGGPPPQENLHIDFPPDALNRRWHELLDARNKAAFGTPPPGDIPELDLSPLRPEDDGPPLDAGPRTGERTVADGVPVLAGDGRRVARLTAGRERLVLLADARATPPGPSVMVVLLPDVAEHFEWEHFAYAEGGPGTVAVRIQAADQAADLVVDWPAAGRPLRVERQGPLDPRQPTGPGRARTVLHLVGEPALTKGGARMRIRAGDGHDSGYTSRGLTEGEYFVGVDDLDVRDTALVVLQAEPADRAAEPLGELRVPTFELARELLAGGAAAVLVVPPLPDDAAAEAVRLVDRAAEESLTSPRGPAELLPLVRELRRLAGRPGRAADDVVLMLAGRPLSPPVAVPRATTAGGGASARVRRWCDRESERLDVVFLPDPGSEPVRPELGYVRLWLAGGSLRSGRGRHVAYGGVALGFAGDRTMFAAVGRPGDRLGMPLTPLLPYGGGAVEIEAALFAGPPGGPVDAACTALAEVAGLVAPPLTVAATVAGRIAAGFGAVLDAADEDPMLAVRYALAGGMPVRSGHLVVARGSLPGLPSIVDGTLHVGTRPAGDLEHLVLRLECRAERDDWLFPELDDLTRRATEAYLQGRHEDFQRLRAEAIATAYGSPDLVPVDRRRVATLVRDRLEALRDGLELSGELPERTDDRLPRNTFERLIEG
ncbi:ATP-binding protein [Dactylosporangium sp. AC04546]|uniref:ATP-binding protein n=1 Tax=Dactylosporangium sp. AC04546 TaxID=2862460 RepID=UPI001EDE3527|nr:ATP-binding protein [Dactylosporangium sp. AC04546]WVK81856.1 ATP-binding protein [Dactylosporangium sp. AC04546]